MKSVSQYWRCAGVLSLAAMLALTACGGGGVDTVTVAKVLEASHGVVAADGTLTMSLFPAPGASQAAVDGLAMAGVASLGKKCATVSSPSGLLTVGGTPTFVVMVEVNSNDLTKAKEAGYFVANDDFMKAISKTFDCESRSL